MLKSIVKILLSQIILIFEHLCGGESKQEIEIIKTVISERLTASLTFEHVETADVIPIRHHFSHCAALVYVSAFHRFRQIFTKPEGIQLEIHAK